MIRVFGRDACQQPLQIAPAHRHAAGGRAKSGAGDVEKHGAAPAGHAGPRVVVDFDDEIVEVIGAAEPVAWFSGRAPERLDCSAGRTGPRTRRRHGPMRRTGSSVCGRDGDPPATTAGPGETGLAGCRRRPRACRPELRRGRARPEWRAARQTASPAPAGPAGERRTDRSDVQRMSALPMSGRL